MKLVKNKPIPPKFAIYRFKAMAVKMKVRDCVEGCTRSEAAKLMMAIAREGFEATSRKQNGSGVSVWKLGRKSFPTPLQKGRRQKQKHIHAIPRTSN